MSICAIIVTYNPDLTDLSLELSACLEQANQTIIIDNRSEPKVIDGLRKIVKRYGPELELLEQPENLGIATAQNIGIAWARANGFSHVLFLDQDSTPQPGMVATLLEALQHLGQTGQPVAAVGPRAVDSRSGKSMPFVCINWHGTTRNKCHKGEPNLINTDFLISSGMVAPLEVFDQVGSLEDGLFIDNVDLEWCFRVRSKGLLLYGVCNAVLEHRLGDQVLHVGNRSVYRHSSLRQYYIMRNRLHLYKRSYAPLGWLFQDALRAVFKVMLFSFVFPSRRENIKMMLHGVRDALKGRYGSYQG